MAYDGNGNYIRAHNWVADAANAIDINATEMDAEDNGFAAALSNAVTRDGQGRMAVDFLPNADNTLNLGSGSFRWASLNGTPINQIVPTQQGIGALLTPRTAAEIAASVTPTNYVYAELDARRYGADLSGATDSTAAINAAIAVAHAKGGGRIYLPTGTYLVGTSTQINFVYNNIYFVGDGTAATGIVNASASNPAITIGDGVTAIFHCGIEKMYFTQKSAVTALNGNTAFSFNKLSQFIVRDVQVSNAQGSPYRGVFFTACAEFFVYNLFVQGCLNDGITCLGTTDASMLSCVCNANGGAGYVLNASQGGEWIGCYAFNNTGVGWGLLSGAPASAPNFNNAFFDCVGDTSGNHNWLIADSFDSWWVGCWGSTQQNIAVNTSACGFQVASQYCVNLKFVGCTADNNNANGFQCFDLGASAPQKIEFIGCQYGSNDQQGSHGNGKAGTGYGFASNGGVDHIRIAGGCFDGNATGAVNNTGSGTDIVVSGNPIGYVTANQGTSSITVGNSSVAVTHGLGFTPAASNIQITPTSSLAASGINSYWISAVSSTTFTISSNVNVATTAFNFAWQARFKGN